MTALLTDNLPLLAGAPNGIKKLRELILELAVRGKLVPQDPSDEPASELLKRIAEEKARLVAEGRIKNPKPLTRLKEEDQSDDLPEGWALSRLGEVVNICTGKLDANAAVPGGEYPFFTCSQTPSSIATYSFDTAAVLLAGNGDFNLKKFQGRFDAYQRTYVIEPVIWSLDFCFISVSAEIERITENNRGSAIPYLKLGDITNPVIWMPPLAEQHSIVAKVDELMALCDRLETQQADAESAHAELVQALLGSLTQATDAEDFAASWQRLAEHFHILFTTESSIDTLKKYLLQLAVMGKLVPQDSSDESGSELLHKLWDENDRLERKLPLDIGGDDAGNWLGMSVPKGWCSCKVSNIAEVKLGSTPSRAEPNYWCGDIPWVSSGEVAGSIIKSTRERITLAGYKNSSTAMIPPGSVLIAMIGQGKTRGQSALLEIEACTNQNVAALIFNTRFVASRYVWIWAQAMYSLHRAGGHGGAQPALNAKKVKAFLLPLPPTAEQHRIVAKVNQLMALCDQLKARLTQARQLNEQLATALVEQAVA